MKLEEINTSEFNEAQKHLYHVAMNMKMQGKISSEGITYFESAIEALTVYNALANHFGDAKDIILDDPAELQKWLERVSWHTKKADELARKLEKVEKVISDWQEDPERDMEAFDSMNELCDIVLSNNQEKDTIDDEYER